MKTFHKIADIQQQILEAKKQGKTIGFVPTMGALHDGHLSLVRAARKENDLVVVSIFVNPIQFNNPEDLKKYPRTFETDAAMLDSEKCDYIFYPSVEEMYPDNEKVKNYDFGALENVMEGEFRPGHFNGVEVVVKKLFDIVPSDHAYFGKKDFQQLAIIRKLVEIENIAIKIHAMETRREVDGLAMSSRNTRLTKDERKVAPEIYQVLNWVKNQKSDQSPQELMDGAKLKLQKNFQPEYFQIVDGYSLQTIGDWTETKYPVACVAAHLGEVRLIDNIEL